MSLLPNVIFAIILFSGLSFFVRNVRKLKRNIYLGKEVDTSGNTKLRWTNMVKIALGQGKMVRRPIACIIDHILGKTAINSTFVDNYWNILPVERLQAALCGIKTIIKVGGIQASYDEYGNRFLSSFLHAKSVLEHYTNHPPKGEIVVVVSGKSK